MFMSPFIICDLLNERLKLLLKFRREIICISTAGANIANNAIYLKFPNYQNKI